MSVRWTAKIPRRRMASSAASSILTPPRLVASPTWELNLVVPFFTLVSGLDGCRLNSVDGVGHISLLCSTAITLVLSGCSFYPSIHPYSFLFLAYGGVSASFSPRSSNNLVPTDRLSCAGFRGEMASVLSDSAAAGWAVRSKFIFGFVFLFSLWICFWELCWVWILPSIHPITEWSVIDSINHTNRFEGLKLIDGSIKRSVSAILNLFFFYWWDFESTLFGVLGFGTYVNCGSRWWVAIRIRDSGSFCRVGFWAWLSKGF